MSDETAPQSAIEVQMLLDDDEETLKVSMSPNPTSQSASLAGIQGQEERVSGSEFNTAIRIVLVGLLVVL